MPQPWERDWSAPQNTTQPAATSGPVMGSAPRPKDPPAPKTSYRTLSKAEAEQRGLDPTKVWQESSEGNLTPAGNAAGSSKTYKTMPQGAAENLEKGVNAVLDFDRITKSYKKDFAGNSITGGLENSIQKRFGGFGTPGQQQWWADVNANDNVMRNALFGASLTAGEQAAWERTTITPDMDPDLVEQNLQRRKEIATSVLKRRTDFFKANGYDPEAVDALLGEGSTILYGDKQAGPADENDPAATGKVNIPPIKGGLPEGTQIQFGMDKQEGPFDRADYIKRRYGVTPDQEDWIIAFWNGNRNNPSLTPDGVKQAYTEAGMLPPDDAGVQEGIANAQKGVVFSAFDTSQAEQEYRNRLNDLNAEAGGMTGAAAEDRTGVAGYANRAYTGATLGLGDEIRGLDAAGEALWAGKNPLDAYAVNRDAERQLQEQSRNEQGVGGWVAEIGGSIPTALMAPGALSRNVGQAAKAGATVGAVQGFGSGEGSGGSTVNALVGGGLGAVTGGAVQGGLNKLASRAPRPNALASDARQIVDAGAEWNVPVKTSDIRPPQTPIGRAARLTGEMIPVAGTGGGMGGRATQQAGREEAVQRFVKEFGGDPASIDDVTADLVATRGKELSTLTRAKDSVIDGIGQTVSPIQLRNTLRTIDTQVAKLNRANSDAFAPVVAKLENFRNTLASGKTLREVEMNRRLLGDLFADPSLASIKGDGQKALNAVYAPLREDMGAFIKGAAGPEAAAKWKGANDRLSAMAGELDNAKFKGILNNAETTPERAAELLFSKRPSDIRRLFENLSEQGKTKARAAIIHEAAKKSTADDVISPDQFKKAMMAMDNATGVVFSKNDKTRIDGFVRLLEATQRAKIANTEVMTGARNTSFIAGLGLQQLFGNMTIPASVAIGLMARGYESTAFRNLIMNLGKAKKGSPAEAAVGRKIYDYITRAGITQGTPANDIVAERVGSSFGQSTTAAAAGEQEQN